MDLTKRFENLSLNKQALFAVRLEKELINRNHQDESTGKRIVAYVVPRKGRTLAANQLRGFLKQRVADYMVPEVFVSLDSLPLTPNGKVDRKSLAAPAPSRQNLDDDFVAPRTELEEELATIWTKVLRVERVGIMDNFFDLGGHSLLATQLVSRIRNAFQVELSLRNLFESPTVATLAVVIVQRLAEALDGEEMAGILAELEQAGSNGSSVAKVRNATTT